MSKNLKKRQFFIYKKEIFQGNLSNVFSLMEYMRLSTCPAAGMLLFLFAITSTSADAADRQGTKSMTMSVTRINTINTDPSFGTIIENMLSEELHRQGDFILIDRKQMERAEKGAAEPKSADKIITGSFVLQSGLLINVLSIDSKSSTVDISLTETVSKNADLSAVVGRIAGDIQRFYSVRRVVSSDFDVTVKPTVFFPAGVYSKYLNPSYGAMAGLNAYNIFDKHASLFASAGVNRFFPKSERYSDFTQFFAACGPALRFNPANPLLLSARAGAGPLWTRAVYDADGRVGERGFEYKTGWFTNICGIFETELALHLSGRWMLALSGGYMFVYDTSRMGSLFFAGAGIKTVF